MCQRQPWLSDRVERGRARTACAAAGLAVWLFFAGPAPLPAQPPRDPVENLRQALRQDTAARAPEALKFREEALKRAAAALRTMNELSRALLLPDWRVETVLDAESAPLSQIDRTVRDGIAKRFSDMLRAGLRSPDATTRSAVANYTGELAIVARSSDTKSTFLRDNIGKAAPELIALTRDADPAVRQAAARALGQLSAGGTDAIKALGELASNPDVATRRTAVAALGNLVRQFSTNQREGRTDVALRDERAAETLKLGQALVQASGRGLRDPDVQVRRLTVLALEQTGAALADLITDPAPQDFPPEGRPLTEEEQARIEEFRKIIAEAESRVRPIMEALGEQAAALGRLAAGDPDAAVRLGAAQALEEMGNSRQKLQRLIHQVPAPAPERKPERAQAPPRAGLVLASAQEPRKPEPIPPPPKKVEPIPPPLPNDPLVDGLRAARPSLAVALRDPDPKVRLAAIKAIEMLGYEAVPVAAAVTAALEDCEFFVRWTAVRTLGRLGPIKEVDPVPALIKVLSEYDLDIRLAATEAFKQYGAAAKAAVPELGRAVNRGDAEFRIAAMDALAAIGTDARPAIPALAEALSSQDQRVRANAARTLGRFGRAAKSAVPALRAVQNDPIAEVRIAVNEALIDILVSE